MQVRVVQGSEPLHFRMLFQGHMIVHSGGEASGFKDRDAWNLETFAGTSSRLSKRIVVSEAVLNGFELWAMDVRKAFLKGVTYEELAEMTGEEIRVVCFDVPDWCVPILREFKGFENFDPRPETLIMIKPGTGCKDAPRCFNIKFMKALVGDFKAQPTTSDDQLIVRHTAAKQLDCIGSVHVDDVLTGAKRRILEELLATLERVFGKGEIDVTQTLLATMVGFLKPCF